MTRKKSRGALTKERKTRLVFRRFSGHDGTFVEERAYKRWKQTWRALHSAKTWGEFRQLIPASEFRLLGNWVANDGTEIYRDGRACIGLGEETLTSFLREFGENIIRPDTPFRPMAVAGYADAEYPPFLEEHQSQLLPRDFLERYGRPVSSMVSGSWWQFPDLAFEEMKAELEGRGFAVRKDQPFDFP